jgi:NAD(P)-dependent dehydrogenase (short-subunit alcohol dehydrogenase family)
VCVVTGAARGIGRAIDDEFAAQGDSPAILGAWTAYGYVPE